MPILFMLIGMIMVISVQEYSNEFPSHTYNDAYTGQVKVYGTAIHWTGSFQTVLIDAPADPSIHNYWPWIKAIVDWVI